MRPKYDIRFSDLHRRMFSECSLDVRFSPYGDAGHDNLQRLIICEVGDKWHIWFDEGFPFMKT
ncbi:hypothetical protein JKP88DRAFT_280898 [Tribonema minus]|uniref:Uncharacterized protein n=1 Tax=Tribonema minus TaxID=303371 RepID=A0A836CC63_9STRA|nr:hypothetical protein JKP88DRAFT_280898 [Tribonema minus]